MKKAVNGILNLSEYSKSLIIFMMIVIWSLCAFEYRQPTATIVTKSLNTSYQLSMYRDVMVSYSVQISAILNLTTGQSGSIELQTSPDNVTWTTQAILINNVTGALSLSNMTHIEAAPLTGFVKSGYYVKLLSSGTATSSWQKGIEVSL